MQFQKIIKLLLNLIHKPKDTVPNKGEMVFLLLIPALRYRFISPVDLDMALEIIADTKPFESTLQQSIATVIILAESIRTLNEYNISSKRPLKGRCGIFQSSQMMYLDIKLQKEEDRC